MAVFVRTPAPHPAESLLGFALRVAEANCYDSPRYVWSVAGIPRGLELAAGFPIEPLSEALGQSPSSLRRIAYRASDDARGGFKILDHTLGDDLRNGLLRLKRPAFCPECAREDGYIGVFWDLAAAVACPRHKVMALRNCPGCQKPLSWMRPGILRCACNASLAVAEQIPADSSVVELMALVQARLHGRDGCGLENSAGLPIRQLMAMPLSALVRMLQTLGAYALPPGVVSSSKGPNAIVQVARILADWPHGYHTFLSELGGTVLQNGPMPLGLRKQFARFYGASFKNRTFSEHAGFLRDEFLRFGHQNWGAAYVDSKFFEPGKAPERTRFMTRTQVARRFQIWKPTMERMIAEGTLVTRKIGAGASARTLIDLDGSRLPAQSALLVTAREAAAALEIPVSVLKELRERGIYKAAPHRGRANSFFHDDVEAFRARAISLPVSVNAATTKGKSIAEIMRLKVKSAGAKAEIISAVFAGTISVCGRNRDTVGGLVLAATEVDRHILDLRCKRQGRMYTLIQCAKATGLDQSTIRNAVKAQLLTGKTVGGTLRITRESVDAFNERYATLSALANRLKTSSRCLLLLCRRNNITIKSVARTTGAVAQAMIRRNDEPGLIARWEASPSGRRARAKPSCAERVRQYLQGLEASGGRLPRRDGRPHKVQIAKACGMSRERIYDNAEIAKMIADFDKLERSAGAATRPIDALRQYLHDVKKSGTSLPLWGGRPNKLMIAQACGFCRQEFSRDPELMAELNSYAKSHRSAASRRS